MIEPDDVRNSAYATAMDRLRKGRVVLCVPGLMEGDPVVFSHICEMGGEAAGYLFDPEPSVRAAFLLGAMHVARERAVENGVVL